MYCIVVLHCHVILEGLLIDVFAYFVCHVSLLIENSGTIIHNLLEKCIDFISIIDFILL